MTATIGTIPALTQYQPGALPLSGQECLEIASSTTPTIAASYYIPLTDLVGKAPSVMPSTNPSADDLIAFFQRSSGLYFSSTISDLGIPSGNMPTGGSAGQILKKNSSTDFDANFANLSSLVSASTGLFLTGSTSIALGIATGGVGSPQLATVSVLSTTIATHAVGNAQFRQGSPLSVVGVSTNATSDVADIIASGGNQVLVTNPAGTGLLFGSVSTTSLPGPFQTGTLTQFGVVYGNGTSALGATLAGTTGLVLLGNGSASAPSFQAINLATTLSLSGTLLFALGGLATSNLTLNGVLLGNSTTAPKITAAPGTGTLFAGIGTANAPVFTTTPILGGTGVTSFLQLAGQTSGVISIMAQQSAGTFNFNLPVSAGTAGYVLTSGGGATSPMTWTQTTFVSNVASGFGLTGGPVTTTGSLSISTTAPPSGFDAPINLGITASVLTGVLTVNFLNAQGATPTATSPLIVPFQNTNATSGVPGWATATSALTISTIVGASLGAANSSSPFRLWTVLLYQNATTMMPALVNCSNTAAVFPLVEGNFATTVAMTATATIAGTFYSPAGTTALNAPYRIAGYVEYANGLATAGTFSTAPTSIKLFGPGVKKPGDIVQTVYTTNGTEFDTTNSTYSATNLTLAITPSSGPNLVEYSMVSNIRTPNATTPPFTQMARGTTAIGPQISGSGGNVTPVAITGIDAPGTTSSTSYVARLKSTDGTTTMNFNYTAANWAGSSSSLTLRELMG